MAVEAPDADLRRAPKTNKIGASIYPDDIFDKAIPRLDARKVKVYREDGEVAIVTMPNARDLTNLGTWRVPPTPEDPEGEKWEWSFQDPTKVKKKKKAAAVEDADDADDDDETEDEVIEVKEEVVNPLTVYRDKLMALGVKPNMTWGLRRLQDELKAQEEKLAKAAQ